jgi:uncharacterized protein (UPF0147 family)
VRLANIGTVVGTISWPLSCAIFLLVTNADLNYPSVMGTTTSLGFHSSSADHLTKMRRIVRRLDQVEMHRDDMDDFCKTAWHLIEHVAQEKELDRNVRRKAQALRNDADLILCEHLANVGKHGRSRLKVASAASLEAVEVSQGYGVGGYGKGGYGIGEQRIVLKFGDGSTRDAAELAATVLAKWEAVFAPDL